MSFWDKIKMEPGNAYPVNNGDTVNGVVIKEAGVYSYPLSAASLGQQNISQENFYLALQKQHALGMGTGPFSVSIGGSGGASIGAITPSSHQNQYKEDINAYARRTRIKKFIASPAMACTIELAVNLWAVKFGSDWVSEEDFRTAKTEADAEPGAIEWGTMLHRLTANKRMEEMNTADYGRVYRIILNTTA